ncbi:bifunctional DNA-formamidopyrimidine glycosylase/DNA-(apurinic or apyrimidinic site) lyase [Mycoplasmopsis anatis]|uniref:Foramidopyrimidine DNA gycosylase n=1 Tax=Mycoplasmopsis anatis 1340 TaxID=1034808 RepID=F9QCM8_9BACT|nr:bifunctional DNA-formamidopyrimidine glycosylase/DNA-(apurinic or apyrimidinic site) lyase [Mycoplasmopsis anatis]AWX69781.1 bifunctional DNA-formamidopyrimidine glycosylase/DNA-(apurinic or apyrimidinic site) lyase [Mycoplasmopsis anatis]EGS29495.1 foramidopyrimidine DNA gycosylase [Mycoplasmopsis anatis 1340]VEU73805.1 foramidopyrimidine DNA gycosylase [Mycoplasmopsis anatis]
MPEYPEVTIVRKGLETIVNNRKITKVIVISSKFIKNTTEKEFINFLVNKTITKVNNIGKFIEFIFDDNSRMISHLRMEGKYYTRDIKLIKEGIREKHDYIIFILDKNIALAYNDTRMFGSFEIIDKEDKRSLYEIKNLAQLPGDVNVDELYKKLQKRTKSIKSILLDQSLVLGIGNIYADETLHKEKVYPMTKCNLISKNKLQKILKSAQEIMDQSINAGGSSVNSYKGVNGKIGTFQNKLFVYGRFNLTCLQCNKEKLIKVKLDFKDNGRGTTYCPRCQKEGNVE